MSKNQVKIYSSYDEYRGNLDVILEYYDHPTDVYKNGEPKRVNHGYFKGYNNSCQLLHEFVFKDGLMHGYQKEYSWLSGKVEAEGEFFEGKKVGVHKSYWHDDSTSEYICTSTVDSTSAYTDIGDVLKTATATYNNGIIIDYNVTGDDGFVYEMATFSNGEFIFYINYNERKKISHTMYIDSNNNKINNIYNINGIATIMSVSDSNNVPITYTRYKTDGSIDTSYKITNGIYSQRTEYYDEIHTISLIEYSLDSILNIPNSTNNAASGNAYSSLIDEDGSPGAQLPESYPDGPECPQSKLIIRYWPNSTISFIGVYNSGFQGELKNFDEDGTLTRHQYMHKGDNILQDIYEQFDVQSLNELTSDDLVFFVLQYGHIIIIDELKEKCELMNK